MPHISAEASQPGNDSKPVRVLLVLALILALHVPGVTLGDTQVIEIELGDHRFTPAEVHIAANQPAVLKLVNTDGMTPHNFTLETAGDKTDINVDVSAGDAVEVRLGPMQAGTYTFYCDKKLPFMKSHRDKGMEGSLIVTAE
jgi:plastocyanin